MGISFAEPIQGQQTWEKADIPVFTADATRCLPCMLDFMRRLVILAIVADFAAI